jgi:polyhydroxyalkanoate synthesis regulator phasin
VSSEHRVRTVGGLPFVWCVRRLGSITWCGFAGYSSLFLHSQTVPAASEKKVIVTLTKSQLSTGRGKELFELLSEITQDGMLSNGEVERLKAWLATSGIDRLPAEEHLSRILSQIIANGSISADERRNFQKEIERVLPPSQRAEAKEARTAREAEFKEMETPVVSAKDEIPDIDRRVVKVSAQQQTKQDALASAVAAHRVQPGQTTFPVTIPGRQPYEPNATLKQKDYLWGLGMRDQTILEALGKWQASAVIEQIKKQQSNSLPGILLVFITFALVGLFAFAKCSQ